MPDRFPPIVRSFPHLLHGGDYNPEQWIRTPEVWDEDIRLLKAAHCNTVSIGIFAWSAVHGWIAIETSRRCEMTMDRARSCLRHRDSIRAG